MSIQKIKQDIKTLFSNNVENLFADISKFSDDIDNHLTQVVQNAQDKVERLKEQQEDLLRLLNDTERVIEEKRSISAKLDPLVKKVEEKRDEFNKIQSEHREVLADVLRKKEEAEATYNENISKNKELIEKLRSDKEFVDQRTKELDIKEKALDVIERRYERLFGEKNITFKL